MTYSHGQVPPRMLRDLIRDYAKMMMEHRADTDLTPRQGKLAGVLLNLTSNSGHANVPPERSTAVAADLRKVLSDLAWDIRPVMQAYSKVADADFGVALTRALECLAGITGQDDPIS